MTKIQKMKTRINTHSQSTLIIKTKSQTHHKIEPLYLKILLLHHSGQARDREKESNLSGESNIGHINTVHRAQERQFPHI